MSHHVLAWPAAPRPTRSGHVPLGGRDPDGRRIAVDGASLRLSGRPWFAVSGELHFSRVDPRLWDDGLAKLRAAGVDVASTYVFWNHHEEVRGRFEWLGAKDLRRFVAACARRDLKVVVRVGPWCHGEARNGGFPDWLYGQPFELRSNDEGYLACVATLYREIAAQLRGLLWKDGGPVVGVQLENEHMHSAAPWEMTTGVSDEWVPAARARPSRTRTPRPSGPTTTRRRSAPPGSSATTTTA
jgi:beta-galactosidase GanA